MLLDEQRAHLAEAEAIAGRAVTDLRNHEKVWAAQQAALREVAQVTARLRSIPSWKGMASSGYGGAADGQINAVAQLVAGSLHMPGSIKGVADLNETIMSNIATGVLAITSQIRSVPLQAPGSFACTRGATQQVLLVWEHLQAEIEGVTVRNKVDEVQALVDSSRAAIPHPCRGLPPDQGCFFAIASAMAWTSFSEMSSRGSAVATISGNSAVST